MSTSTGGSSERSAPRQGMARAQLLAAGLAVVPLYSTLILLELVSGRPLSLRSFVVYLAVIAPLSMVIAWLSLRFLCGEGFRGLNLRPGRPYSDLLSALALSLATLVAGVVSTALLLALLPAAASDTSVRDLFRGLAGNPGLLTLFLVLLLPLGAASEELIRVLLLSRLWNVWPSTSAKGLAVAVSAVLFGFLHLYHGTAAIIWTALYGLVMGLYYLRFGRVVPMILSHYLTNALQVVAVAVLAR